MTEPRSTPNPATSTRPSHSSGRVAHKKPLGFLPWLLLGLLALLLAIVFLVVNAIDDDGRPGDADDALGQAGDAATSAPASPSSSSAPAPSRSASAPAAAPAPAGGGTLVAGGQDVIAAGTSGALAPLAGQAATGTAPVQEVVADEGFWVGSSAQERVYVFLTPEARRTAGESGFQVTAGQTVRLTGSVVALAQQPDAAAGVESTEGAPQLQQQGHLVVADSVELG